MARIRMEDPEHLSVPAKEFLKEAGESRIFAFYGNMGAGKTTFIKALCLELGVTDVINSPTFAIVNEYYSPGLDDLIYHFDFYRINSAREAYDLGTPDYFDSGCYCFIEWPEKIAELLPEKACRVDIREEADGSRLIEF